MAGIFGKLDNFLSASIEMHVNSITGSLPWYTIETSDGNLNVVEGSWKLEKDEDGNEIPQDLVQAMMGNGTPVPPKTKKGEVAYPVIFILRNPDSPDADAFCKDNGLDKKEYSRIEKMNKILQTTNRGTFQKQKIKEDRAETISAASMIAGFKNVAGEPDENGVSQYLEYSPELAMKIVEKFEAIKYQIRAVTSDIKKFESPS